MDLVSNWMHVEIFTVDQAAALWCSYDPASLDNPLKRKPPEFSATKQMIVSAILARELSSDSSNNVYFSIGDYSRSYVNRTGLESLARKRNLYPAFLFDTLAPFTDSGQINIAKGASPLQTVTTVPVELSRLHASGGNKGGRPAQYDWNSFTSEIIHRANQPDGLPPTQAQLTRDMLAWFLERFGSEPAESSVRDRISKIYNYLENAKNRTL